MASSVRNVGEAGNTTLTQKKRQPHTLNAVMMAGGSEMPNPRRYPLMFS